MEKKSGIFFMKARSRKSIEAANIVGENERRKKALQVKTPVVGPRSKFTYYINDLNLDFEKAVNKVLEEFPALDRDIIQAWSEESTKKERMEQKNNER